MRSYAITDVGQKRDCNQDYIYCNENPVGVFPNIFVVADGMGGHKAGDFASRFCVEEFVRRVKESKEKTIIGIIEHAIYETNEQLIMHAKEHPEYEGMGTTFVMASLFPEAMYVANIGDSRLYVINSEMKQITEDHSLVAEMVRDGEIKKEEARFHPKKNVVTKALSASGIVVPDYFEVHLKKDDKILICSDGLTTMLSDIEIFDIINEYDGKIEDAANELVKKANENGGKDNVSIILVDNAD